MLPAIPDFIVPSEPQGAPAGAHRSSSSAVLSLEDGLRTLGYTAFRPGQERAIETLLLRQRLLYVAPTGGGKSLVYQLPAVLLPGTTIVVSPLVALMQDQVDALLRRNVAASFLAATLGHEEMERRLRAAARGEYRLLYVAPERLATGGFQRLLRALHCPLIAIDEAHCISEWGHDFRPEYMQIGSVLQHFPNARVLACTATATPVVRDEIIARLQLGSDTPQIVHGFARPNLILRALEIQSSRDRAGYVDALLREALGKPGALRQPSAAGVHAAGAHGVREATRALGSSEAAPGPLPQPEAAIIYSPTRAGCAEEAGRLAEAGWSVGYYHAGLEPAERERTQQRFMRGELQVVVATNAFGMGIDRADVRAVIHLAPPSSLEAYYQEVGRAGRDGERSYALLLTTPNDMPLRRRLLESNPDGEPIPAAVIEHKWGLFLELMRWIEGGSCRHDAILRYFGDQDEALGGCGQCDVCSELQGAEQQPAAEEVQLIVRKALSGIARVHGRYGLSAAVKLLRGAKDERLARAGLDRVRTYGVLMNESEEWLTRLLRRLVTAGLVVFSGDDRPLVHLTEEGRAVMEGRRAPQLLLPERARRIARSSARRRAAADGYAPEPARYRGETLQRTPESENELDESALELFEALRAHRLSVARSEAVPPFVVASDRTLRDIARTRPRSQTELLGVYGMGPVKAARYGAGFLTVIESRS
jgi:ATP-dependent DNA helicase RecQ